MIDGKREFLVIVHTPNISRAEVNKRMLRLVEKGYIKTWRPWERGYLWHKNGDVVKRIKVGEIHERWSVSPWGFVDINGRYHTPITNVEINEYIAEVRETADPESYFHALACTN